MFEKRAIFLDRDNTLIEDKGYVHKKKDLRFIPLVITGLKILQKEYPLIIVTNQSGIAKGYYTEKDYLNFRNHMHKKFNESGIKIAREYFCPHHPEGKGEYKLECKCRKPKIGMLEKAAYDFNLDLSLCWMIGDSETDIQTGVNALCETIYITNGNKKNIKDADFIAPNLFEAAKYILQQEE